MSESLTQTEVDALQESGLHRNTPYIIRGVSQGHLSIARYYGGAKFNGSDYSYVPNTDELIRNDCSKVAKDVAGARWKQWRLTS